MFLISLQDVWLILVRFVTGQLNKAKDDKATPTPPVPTARFRNLALKRRQFDITGLGIKKAELKGRDDEDSFAVSLSISCDTSGKQLLGLTKQQLSYLQREQVVLNLLRDTDELYCPTAVELQEFPCQRLLLRFHLLLRSQDRSAPLCRTLTRSSTQIRHKWFQTLKANCLASYRVTLESRFLVCLVNFVPCAFV